MNLTNLLPPRLRDWYNTGPVQRAELEQFAQALLSSKHTAVTADGKLVQPGTEVWVISSTGAPKLTTVRPTEPITNYTLFGNIPVAHSFSTKEVAEIYRKHNR